MMDQKEFTYLKSAFRLKKEIEELEEQFNNCQKELDELLDYEKGNPVILYAITEKMTIICEKIESKENEVKSLFSMICN